ncbi:MAG TPA: triple tyrosine motif-containing protein, partial [Ideonella sp.]|nr:triple tyrosine motif-containing protein [Ideonella sp.]
MRRLLWLALAVCGAQAHAIPADIPLDQLHHTRWTAADGAPSGARAMAQTADGALWIGTESGLYRFDGVQFERMRAGGRDGRPLGYVAALLALPDGSLWIGLGYGGMYHWQGGRFTAQGPADGLPGERTVRNIVQGSDGQLWAGTSDGLFVREGARWRRAGAEIGHPGGYILDLLVDAGGSLWIAGTEGVFSLPAGSRRVQRHHAGSYFGDLAARADGSIWLSTGRPQGRSGDLLPLRRSPGQPARVGLQYAPGKGPHRILTDRDGGLWASHREQVMRLPDPGGLRTWLVDQAPAHAQYFGVQRGLSGDSHYYFFEDREGSVWVSTDQGLDRFKLPRVRPAGSGPGESRLADTGLGDSGLAVADDGGPLLCTINDGVQTARGPVALLAPAGVKCEAMDREPSGRRWLAIDMGVWWWHQGQIGRLELPAEVQPVLSIPALKMDAAGSLWVSFIRKGLYRYRDGRWTWMEPGRDGFPSARPISMGRDAAGRVWLGYPGSRVALAEGERARSWGPEQGLQVGEVHMIEPHGDTMLIGGSDGLAMLADGRVTPLQGAGGERFEGVGAIVEAGDGSWWIHAANTISRLPAAELAQARRNPGHRLAIDRFGHADGLRGIAPPGAPWPSAVRTQDGRLWFSTSTRLYALHPERIARNPRPPAVELRGLRVEGSEALLADGQQLPVGTKRLELGYAALHIGAPERVRYRYRLEGVDTEWQLTAARSATYTNLAPGEYTFRVSAANEDGVWNEQGVSTRLAIPPAFHQTAWFYALCAAAVGAMAWGGHRLRIRQLTTRIRLRAEAKTQERERI